VTALFTLFALAGFAANSILCRVALGPRAIDPASFTAVRLASGAAALALFAAVRRTRHRSSHAGSWTSALLLFLYAMPFSFAYVSLGVATGALILFLSVQATMLAGALIEGERIHWLEALGIASALAGLVYLVAPGLSAPDPRGAVLMAAAGAAWGIYTLRGRRSQDAIGDTAANFVRSVPLAIAAGALLWALARAAGRAVTPHVSTAGLLLATASGVLASGAGYAAWFAALRGLRALQAAALQLTVPVIAAAGGILFLSERISMRLVVSAALILGGVGMALGGRAARTRVVSRSSRSIKPLMG
jgi:drug/metabolite transporter (DMT)-like permease